MCDCVGVCLCVCLLLLLLCCSCSAAAFAIYLRVLCAENLPAGHQSPFTARTYTLRPAQPNQASSQPFALASGKRELNWGLAAGSSVSSSLPRSLGCLSTLWAEECNSIEQQYQIELKKAYHNSELGKWESNKSILHTCMYIRTRYVRIHTYTPLPRRWLFSILIAPKMAPNECKLCLHTNLKLKCNLKKCFKMHFRACWQSFLWLSEATLRIRTGGGINFRIHASCIYRLTQRFICALSLFFSLVSTYFLQFTIQTISCFLFWKQKNVHDVQKCNEFFRCRCI